MYWSKFDCSKTENIHAKTNQMRHVYFKTAPSITEHIGVQKNIGDLSLLCWELCRQKIGRIKLILAECANAQSWKADGNWPTIGGCTTGYCELIMDVSMMLFGSDFQVLLHNQFMNDGSTNTYRMKLFSVHQAQNWNRIFVSSLFFVSGARLMPHQAKTFAFVLLVYLEIAAGVSADWAVWICITTVSPGLEAVMIRIRREGGHAQRLSITEMWRPAPRKQMKQAILLFIKGKD